VQSVAESVDGDAVFGIESFDELDKMGLGIGEREILHPPGAGFVPLMAVARKGVDIVEQNDSDAADSRAVKLREIGECVGRERLRRERLRRNRPWCRGGGFRGEDADLLRFASVEEDEVVLREIEDGAVFVAGDDAYLN